MEQKNYLTSEQLAERWGVCTGTLSNWRSQKKLRYVKSLGKVFYRLTDVLAFERKNKIVTKSSLL